MSVKGKIAVVVTLAVVGGAAVAATLPADAATPQCGHSCVDLYGGISVTLGHPSFVIDSYLQGQVNGTPIILSGAGNTDPGEDFVTSAPELVSLYFLAGLVSPEVALHYGCVPDQIVPICPSGAENLLAFEIQYAPYGALTGSCVGVAATATSGAKVALQPCGVSGKTVWIVDSSASVTGSFVPLINGSDTDFTNPFVLTYPSGASPTDQPAPQLLVDNLTENSGQVPDSQLWSEGVGVLDALSLTTPADITTDATGPSGATVTYPAPVVTDIGNTSPPAAGCTPASGSVFPIGTTTVTCTVTDHGDFPSTASSSFTVTVEGAAAQLADLRQAVRGFGFDNIPALLAGIAQQQLSAGHPTLACQTLTQFITDVRLQVPASTAAQLITDAKRIQAVLGGCGRRPPL
jgi:hypothetical protein